MSGKGGDKEEEQPQQLDLDRMEQEAGQDDGEFGLDAPAMPAKVAVEVGENDAVTGKGRGRQPKRQLSGPRTPRSKATPKAGKASGKGRTREDNKPCLNCPSSRYLGFRWCKVHKWA